MPLSKNKILNVCKIVFGALLIMSCSNKKDSSCENQYSVIEDKTNKIKVRHDSLSAPNNCTMVYKLENNNQAFIYSLNRLHHSIDKYATTGSLLDRISLQKEGPNGVGLISNFFVKTPDSIFVISSRKHHVSIINSKGVLLRTYPYLYNNKEELGKGLISYGTYANQILVKNNVLYVGATPFDDPTFKRFYDKGKAGLELDLVSGSVNSITFLPEQWLKNYEDGFVLTGQQTEVGYTYNAAENKCIISYKVDNEVYEVDLLTKQTVIHDAGSCFFDKIQWYQKVKALSHDVEGEFKYYSKQPQYASIYYDQYQQMYYRFVAHPNKAKQNDFDGKSWFIYSIVILDKRLNKVGETLLQDGFQPNNVLITPKGIYLQQYQKDDQYSYFNLFKIIKNE